MVEPRQGATPELTAAKAVLVGHLVVTLPVLIVIAIGAAVGSEFNHATAGLIVGCLVGWIVWAFLVPLWRDWVSGTTAPMGEVQRLAQLTGLVWRQGSALERTEIPRKTGRDTSDLALLSEPLRLSAIVESNGEVRWPFAFASQAVNELAERGFVILGLDVWPDESDAPTEVPLSSYDGGTSQADVAASREHALAALTRAPEIGWPNPRILVTWRRAS